MNKSLILIIGLIISTCSLANGELKTPTKPTINYNPELVSVPKKQINESAMKAADKSNSSSYNQSLIPYKKQDINEKPMISSKSLKF